MYDMILDMQPGESTEEEEGKETFLRRPSRRTSCTEEATMIGSAIAMLRPRQRSIDQRVFSLSLRGRLLNQMIHGPAADWKKGDAVAMVDRKLEGELKQSDASTGI